MADGTNTNGGTEGAVATAPAKPATDGRLSMKVALAPVGTSDQPVVANYTSISAAPGMAFIDFGFLEPGLLTALPGVARLKGKLPERIGGKLSVRVAMGYDALANLHQQLASVFAGFQAAAKERQSVKARD